MRYSIILALSGLLIAGCSDDSQPLTPNNTGATRAVLENTWETQSFIFPKLSTCRDEDIAMEARRHEVFAVTEDGAGGFHVVYRYGYKLTGRGLTSGAQYVGTEQGVFVINAKDPYPHVESVVINTRLIGKGKAGDYTFSARGHITVNANGEVTSQFREFDMSCR